MPRLVGLAMVLLCAASALAGTYYVSPTGSDSAGGDIGHPWQTLAKASTAAQGGDTVYFRAGTYTGTLLPNNTGTTDRPITFAAYPGEKPVIDGQGTTQYNIGPTASSYLVFDGLELKNVAGENILFWGGNNRTIRNCVIHDAQLNCVQFHNARTTT